MRGLLRASGPLSLLLLSAGVRAQDTDELELGSSTATSARPDGAEGHDDSGDDPDAGEYGAVGVVAADDRRRDEAASRVTRTQLEERIPRSAPDALRYEPGVYVQQTAHAQASPYVRGLTGQQVVHVYDGVRLNNGIYRQGPNQYFFTVDTLTLRSLSAVRGSGSVLWGADALGGALIAEPREPFIDPDDDSVELHPRAYGRFASADLELGGRAELEARLGARWAVLVGAGYRHVDRLDSGGVVPHLIDVSAGGTRGDRAPWVPRFEEEADHPTDLDAWSTQLGTGFQEITFDARVVHRLDGGLRVVGAVYGYRQLDAPRTDQCPPPEAPIDECLSIVEQFRTLGYVSLRGDAGDTVRDLNLTLSFQNHHEERVRDRPRSSVRFDWADDVDTLGISFRAATPAVALGDRSSVTVRYGAEAHRDRVASEASQSFTDIDRSFRLSRGQYIDGSLYAQLGAFADVELSPWPWLALRAGGRGALIGLRAAADPESGSARIRTEHGAFVGRAAVAVAPAEELEVVLNVDQGFRAPNLDDATSRQQVGPGFQFENPGLGPERSTSFELGVTVDADWLRLDAWAFATLLDDGIVRAVREATDCPEATPACQASRNQLQLVNADGTAVVLGAEAGATLYLPEDFTIRTTISYAWGEGPNTGSRPSDPVFGDERVPLSRVPPLNGTVEARWRHVPTGVYVAGAMRWAAAQTRLAPSDVADARIPIGGTREYAVFDLRGGYRWSDHLRLSLVFENLFDAAWRAHGSSVNGPGRGLLVNVMVGY